MSGLGEHVEAARALHRLIPELEKQANNAVHPIERKWAVELLVLIRDGYPTTAIMHEPAISD